MTKHFEGKYLTKEILFNQADKMMNSQDLGEIWGLQIFFLS